MQANGPECLNGVVEMWKFIGLCAVARKIWPCSQSKLR